MFLISRYFSYALGYRGEQGRIAPNILERNFKADQPNRKWATDVTEFNVSGSKLYLSPIIDLYNGEIISYDLSERPAFAQVMNMLKKGLRKIKNTENLIIHSDQGWQYQMKAYQHLLREKGIIQSMSRKGNCLDNAVIENFFGTLKSEMFHTKKFKTIDELPRSRTITSCGEVIIIKPLHSSGFYLLSLIFQAAFPACSSFHPFPLACVHTTQFFLREGKLTFLLDESLLYHS
ncbi:IS3 family transposase [Chryseobacterium candidae]|uniref:IS3 family transposase n=1 Tax=Chryseobacterium candidae TaxID=1978493 RepID=A0ABY2R705_9FLAO|nr:IS3 family transposase [Chryseobacterium candidae]